VDPVDPRTALDRIHRTDTAEHEDRYAIAPRVEDRHGGVHEADIGVQRDRHRPSRDARVAMRDRHGVLFVHAQENFGLRVAEMIDQAVVQAAEACSRRERDIVEVERAQHVGDRVASEGQARGGHRFDARRGVAHDALPAGTVLALVVANSRSMRCQSARLSARSSS
jgi:hypothetical protein